MIRVDRTSLEIELDVRLSAVMIKKGKLLRSRIQPVSDGAVTESVEAMLSEVDSRMARVMRIDPAGRLRPLTRQELEDALLKPLTEAIGSARKTMTIAARAAIIAMIVEVVDNDTTYVERRDGNAMYRDGKFTG